MSDVPIEGGGDRDYPSDMEARVRVLEEIAANTKSLLGDIRADQRASRTEMIAGFAALRAEMTTGFAAVRGEMTTGLTALRTDMNAIDQRRERDFCIMFGATITMTLGLAFLIARVAHWL